MAAAPPTPIGVGKDTSGRDCIFLDNGTSIVLTGAFAPVATPSPAPTATPAPTAAVTQTPTVTITRGAKVKNSLARIMTWAVRILAAAMVILIIAAILFNSIGGQIVFRLP